MENELLLKHLKKKVWRLLCLEFTSDKHCILNTIRNTERKWLTLIAFVSVQEIAGESGGTGAVVRSRQVSANGGGLVALIAVVRAFVNVFALLGVQSLVSRFAIALIVADGVLAHRSWSVAISSSFIIVCAFIDIFALFSVSYKTRQY